MYEIVAEILDAILRFMVGWMFLFKSSAIMIISSKNIICDTFVTIEYSLFLKNRKRNKQFLNTIEGKTKHHKNNKRHI